MEQSKNPAPATKSGQSRKRAAKIENVKDENSAPEETVGGAVGGLEAPAVNNASEAENAAESTVETVPDVAGDWSDVEERLYRVKYQGGIYLRVGPHKRFAPLQVLPVGTVIFAPPVPEYARVPGWLCVGFDAGPGEPVYGWVMAELVEAVEI